MNNHALRKDYKRSPPWIKWIGHYSLSKLATHACTNTYHNVMMHVIKPFNSRPIAAEHVTRNGIGALGLVNL